MSQPHPKRTPDAESLAVAALEDLRNNPVGPMRAENMKAILEGVELKRAVQGIQGAIRLNLGEVPESGVPGVELVLRMLDAFRGDDTRGEIFKGFLEFLIEKMVDLIPVLPMKTIHELLPMTFTYINFISIKPVVHGVLERLGSSLPTNYIDYFAKREHRATLRDLPKSIQRVVWGHNRSTLVYNFQVHALRFEKSQGFTPIHVPRLPPSSLEGFPSAHHEARLPNPRAPYRKGSLALKMICKDIGGQWETYEAAVEAVKCVYRPAAALAQLRVDILASLEQEAPQMTRQDSLGEVILALDEICSLGQLTPRAERVLRENISALDSNSAFNTRELDKLINQKRAKMGLKPKPRRGTKRHNINLKTGKAGEAEDLAKAEHKQIEAVRWGARQDFALAVSAPWVLNTLNGLLWARIETLAAVAVTTRSLYGALSPEDARKLNISSPSDPSSGVFPAPSRKTPPELKGISERAVNDPFARLLASLVHIGSTADVFMSSPSTDTTLPALLLPPASEEIISSSLNTLGHLAVADRIRSYTFNGVPDPAVVEPEASEAQQSKVASASLSASHNNSGDLSAVSAAAAAAAVAAAAGKSKGATALDGLEFNSDDPEDEYDALPLGRRRSARSNIGRRPPSVRTAASTRSNSEAANKNTQATIDGLTPAFSPDEPLPETIEAQITASPHASLLSSVMQYRFLCLLQRGDLTAVREHLTLLAISASPRSEGMASRPGPGLSSPSVMHGVVSLMLRRDYQNSGILRVTDNARLQQSSRMKSNYSTSTVSSRNAAITPKQLLATAPSPPPLIVETGSDEEFNFPPTPLLYSLENHPHAGEVARTLWMSVCNWASNNPTPEAACLLGAAITRLATSPQIQRESEFLSEAGGFHVAEDVPTTPKNGAMLSWFLVGGEGAENHSHTRGTLPSLAELFTTDYSNNGHPISRSGERGAEVGAGFVGHMAKAMLTGYTPKMARYFTNVGSSGSSLSRVAANNKRHAASTSVAIPATHTALMLGLPAAVFASQSISPATAEPEVSHGEPMYHFLCGLLPESAPSQSVVDSLISRKDTEVICDIFGIKGREDNGEEDLGMGMSDF